MKNLRVAFILSTAALASANRAGGQAADLSSERLDALCVLLGKSDKFYQDGLIPTREVDRVLIELAAIRASEPKMLRVHAFPPFELRTLLLCVKGLVPPTLEAHKRRLLLEQKVSDPLATGIQEWDNLNRRFGAGKINVLPLGNADDGDVLSITYENPLNIEAVSRIYTNQLSTLTRPTFVYFQPNGTIGDGDRIERNQIGRERFEYIFSTGSGDCPAGCIHRTYYTFRLSPSANGFDIERLPDRKR